MSPRGHAVLVNASILAGLLLMFFRGTPLLPIFIVGAVVLTFANVVLAMKRKKLNKANRI